MLFWKVILVFASLSSFETLMGEFDPLSFCSFIISANSSKSTFAKSDTNRFGLCVSRFTTSSKCEL